MCEEVAGLGRRDLTSDRAIFEGRFCADTVRLHIRIRMAAVNTPGQAVNPVRTAHEG